MVIGSWSQILHQVGPDFLKRMDQLDCDADSERKLKLDTNIPPAIKLQINAGGGSFPLHYDNPGPPNKRSLTCIVYLNPNWTEGDGGEIVLWPFLDKPMVIPPLHRRAVLFYSDCILHKVLPSNKRRMCFTMWCNGKNVNAKQDVMLSKDHLQFASYDEAQLFFSSSPLQRVISRAVYSEEYIESLLLCLVTSDDKKGTESGIEEDKNYELTKQHESNVMAITTKLRPLIEEFRRRKNAYVQPS